MQPTVERIDSREAGIDDIARADLTAFEEIGKLGERALR
jgi:hypothetical protein